jgi:hypothetical protein
MVFSRIYDLSTARAAASSRMDLGDESAEGGVKDQPGLSERRAGMEPIGEAPAFWSGLLSAEPD